MRKIHIITKNIQYFLGKKLEKPSVSHLQRERNSKENINLNVYHILPIKLNQENTITCSLLFLLGTIHIYNLVASF